MRRAIPLFTLLLLAAAGCATHRPMAAALVSTRPTSEPTTAQTAPARPPAASALAFTPPVARGTDDLNLNRDERGPYALAGYEDVVISETWVRQDDQQRYDEFGDFGRFERRAVSTTVTVRQR